MRSAPRVLLLLSVPLLVGAIARAPVAARKVQGAPRCTRAEAASYIRRDGAACWAVRAWISRPGCGAEELSFIWDYPQVCAAP